ncbi:DUF2252 family protein [Acidipila sp. EB88]|uniref:DUF2252 family protein n=1 Tax=Acidipila sp. EB88 TaxID=2305226 RepID=UPI000F60330C|nr:DUF2252 family protein [Acidipila sp. EB88]RRA47270.1 DUF2252 domain-containing protein [Acidipila sp. EB88]
MSKSRPNASERKSVLQRRQHEKMAESAHAYVRGNTVQFYQWLQSKAVQAALPAGPDVWICGDCHTGNLGPVADVDGNIDIQIRDLDQTVIGNPAHDLVRLGLSLAMAARSSDLPGVTTALMLEEMISGYVTALSGGTNRVDINEVEPIRRVMVEAKTRRWKHLAEERIENVKPTIPLGKKFWSLNAAERAELEKLFASDDIKNLVQRIDGKDAREVRLLDAAYWMKGCSSLGQLRYAVLLGIGTKKRPEYRLLDIKEANAAAAPHAKGVKMPANNADRVVTGACALSPFLGERMLSGMIGQRTVFVRELRPQDLKFELVGLQQKEAVAIASLMAGVVGRAHGRQVPREERLAWAKELKTRHGKGLDAPRWLWSGVLDLAALHEAAYLEHCRRYALGESAA